MTEDFEQLDALTAQLDRGLPPQRDLWPQIDAAISTEHGGFWQWRVAASVLATSALIGILIFQPDAVDEGAVASAPTPVPTIDQGMFRYAGLDQEYITVHQRSLEQLADQLDELPPGTRDVVIGNLKIIRASIAEINTAIEREPNNVQLRQLLQLAYRQEMAIVSTIRDSANTVKRTTT